MKILVTGNRGFVGQQIMSSVANVVGLDFKDKVVNINNIEEVRESLDFHQPTDIIHLAAKCHVPTSFENPFETYQTNVLGTLNILSSLKEMSFTGKLLYISSGDTYGMVNSKHLPIKETYLQYPRSPYASSKVSAEVLCKQFCLAEGLQIVIARPFNHIGPGQSPDFVASRLARKFAQAKLELSNTALTVGNLKSTRDFTDVRDVVSAYMLLLRYGTPGEVYNVCSGAETSINELYNTLSELTGLCVKIVTDTKLVRQNEQPRVLGCNEKLVRVSGWRHKLSIRESLEDIFKYWCDKIS